MCVKLFNEVAKSIVSSSACSLIRFYFSGHPWIVDDNVAPDRPLGSAVLSRLKQFYDMNKFKKMALRVSILLLDFLLFF